MALKQGYPSVVDNPGNTSLVNGSTVLGVLSDGNDSTAVHFARGATLPSTIFTFSGWNLPARNPAAAQSYNIILRVRSQLTTVGGSGNLQMTINMGGSAIYKATVYAPPGNYQTQDNKFVVPNTAAYWNGTASSISLVCTYVPTIDQNQASDGYILEMGMSYGEADGYVDVTANTAYTVTAPNTSSGVITNPANAANGTSTFATIAPTTTSGNATCDFLVRRIPSFSLPVNTVFAGAEFWDILSENVGGGAPRTALQYDSFTVGNYPASAPDSSTPGVTMGTLADPAAATMVYPGFAEVVFFGGPGDTMLGGVNGWTGISASRLMTGGYEFRSQIITFGTGDYGAGRTASIYMRDLKVRMFYNYTASSAGSLSLSDV